MNGRILSLDLIKIVAMLMVLMLHVNLFKSWSGTGWTEVYYNIPCIAIPLFFMVSGYLMTDKKVTFRYIWNKIGRILIFSFWVSLLVDVIEYIFYGNIKYSFPLCFVQVGNLGVFWYFGAMIIVYACIPLLQRIIDSKYFPYILLCLVLICNIVFIKNHWKFEVEANIDICGITIHKIRQTFRLYYWFTYFLMGAWIKRNPQHVNFINLWWILPACALYCLFCSFDFVEIGNEFYFGSLPCQLYAIVVFSALLNLRIKENNVIKALSETFLPIYAFHCLFLKYFFRHDPFNSINNTLPIIWATAIDYVLFSAGMIIFGLLVMKLPYSKKIFRL